MHKSGYTIAAALILSATATSCNSAKTEAHSVVTGVAYVGATVSNLDQTVEMYMQSADLKQVQDISLSGIGAIDNLLGRESAAVSARMMQSVNAQVRYMQFDQSSPEAQQHKAVPVQGPGIAHVCFQVNKNTNTYQRFLENGATHIGALEIQQLNPKNPVEYAYATDKDGLIIEIEHVDVEKLDLETPPEHQYRIRHVSLATPDIVRLKKFYGALTGEKKPRYIGRLGGFGGEALDNVSGLKDSKVKMAWVQTKNLEIEMIQYVSHPTELPQTPRPLDAIGYNMIVFDVADLTEAKERFTAAGGEIVSDIEQMDGGQIIFGRDPDKNLIGLQMPAAGAIASSEKFEDNGT